MTFDDWKALYARDPVAFENARREALREAIEKRVAETAKRHGPERAQELQRNLCATVWQLDKLRRKYKDPLVWNSVLKSLMMKSLSDLNRELKKLV